MNWDYLKSYFDNIYNEKIRSYLLSKIAQKHLDDYLYYEKNISTHFRSGIPHTIGLMLNIPENKIIPVCAFAESAYCISLIQDDIIDNDDTRWNMPTHHKINSTSYSMSYANLLYSELSKDLDVPILDKIYHDYSLWRSFFIEQNLKIGKTDDVYSDIISVMHLKTSTGIFANMMISKYCNGIDNDTIRAIFNYSSYLGIAGQLKDDLMDISTNEDVSLYSRKSDAKNEYKNFVSIGYNKVQILDLIKHCTKKAKYHLDIINNNYPNSECYNILNSWIDVHYERAKDL